VHELADIEYVVIYHDYVHNIRKFHLPASSWC